jgi:spoIIIJ-associated protein
MPSELVYEGKTVEHALQRASKALNLPEGEIKHDVLSYGSSGIFGIVGAKKAKIRISLSIKKKDWDNKEIEEKKRTKPRAIVNEIPEKEESTKNPEEKPVEDLKENVPSDSEADVKQASQNGLEALQKIIGFISDDAVVTLKNQNGAIIYDISKGNSAVLIGRRGQTLDAIQYIIEKIVNKQTKRRQRVHVDVEGYIEKRKNNLIKTAKRLAQKAKTVGKPMSIGQMNAHDRRIVHLALKNDRSVRTQSLGDGLLRRLVIFPKRARSPKKNETKKQE